MPKIIIESHIPAVPDSLALHAEVLRLAPAEITPAAVADADALIVRTRTRCDASLLKDSRVRIVATATIGTDHLDLPWLASRGIEAVSAPGCNAPAVGQYVMAALLRHPSLCPDGDFTRLHGKNIAVVGVGHVGSIVARWARSLGFNLLPVDPPRQLRGDLDFQWLSLKQSLPEADIITLHTPLVSSGSHSTFHLIDEATLARCRPGVVIVNAARGPVADNQALLNAFRSGHIAPPVIDCWENEPRISLPLLDIAATATPHIAGYSREGKLRATRRAVEAVCRCLDIPVPEFPHLSDPTGVGIPSVTPDLILSSYDPAADTAALKSSPSSFEALRNNYDYRPEPSFPGRL